MSKKMACAGVVLLAGVVGSSASAATLVGSVNAVPPATENLTADGTVDWAIWDYQSGSAGSSGAPSNRKSGGAAIGNASAVMGGLRGITGTMTPPQYTYTNGTSPGSATNAAIGSITSNALQTVGAGVQFSVTGDPGAVRTVNVFVAGFQVRGAFSATLNGAPAYTDNSVLYGSPRTGAVYTLSFQPDSAADVLQVKYTIDSLNGTSNGNVDLQAVTVSVPEPVGVGVIGLGVVGLMRRRKR